MNDYENLVYTLRCLQTQQYNKQHIITVWQEQKNNVLRSLNHEKIIAILKDDVVMEKKIQQSIMNLGRLGKTIQQGLLESISLEFKKACQ